MAYLNRKASGGSSRSRRNGEPRSHRWGPLPCQGQGSGVHAEYKERDPVIFFLTRSQTTTLSLLCHIFAANTCMPGPLSIGPPRGNSGKRVRIFSPRTNTITTLSPLYDPSFPPLQPREPSHQIPSVHPAISLQCHGRAPFHFDVAKPPPGCPMDSRSLQRQSWPTDYCRPFQSHLDPPWDLGDPATTPAMSHIYLTSDLLPWYFEVKGSQTDGTVPVTVPHILNTLYKKLQTRITTTEWDSLSKDAQDFVARAFYTRINRIRTQGLSLSEEQLKKGVKRLDFLDGKTKLLGVSANPDKWGHFTLYLGPVT